MSSHTPAGYREIPLHNIDLGRGWWFLRRGQGYATGSCFVAKLLIRRGLWQYGVYLFVGGKGWQIGSLMAFSNSGVASSVRDATAEIERVTFNEEQNPPF